MTSLNLNPKKQRRDQRPEQPRPMRETENDRRIVELVYQYRLLSQSQIERLLVKSRSRTQQALMRLYHHQYLQRLFLPVWFDGRSPTLYRLDKRGIALLQGLGIEDFSGLPSPKLSPLFLEHTLALNDFRIAMTQACEAQEWNIPVWKTENDIKEDYDYVTVQLGSGKAKRLPIVPDSYFLLDLPSKGVSHFFVELDRGTMTTQRFKEKVLAYVEYYKHGGYQKRFQAQGFRVLTVVDAPSRARLENLVQQTAKVTGIGRRFWFTSLAELKTEAVLTQQVWRVAGAEEREALFSVS
jgi:hypothetical protein